MLPEMLYSKKLRERVLPNDGQLFPNLIRAGLPTAREVARFVNTSAFERSRFAADAFACQVAAVFVKE